VTTVTARESLTLEEAVRAMAAIADRNLGSTVSIHSYRTHTGDPFPPGGKAAWDGPLAHEIRVKVAVTENYVASAEIEALLSDLRDLGFEAYFQAGGYEDGYLNVCVGWQGQRRVLTDAPSGPPPLDLQSGG
jgi:hypothetical protein